MKSSFVVALDEWLAIYTFTGGPHEGHQSVRVTELWPEWLDGNGEEPDYDDPIALGKAETRVKRRAVELGPPEHGTGVSYKGTPTGGWCGVCEGMYDDDPDVDDEDDEDDDGDFEPDPRD